MSDFDENVSVEKDKNYKLIQPIWIEASTDRDGLFGFEETGLKPKIKLRPLGSNEESWSMEKLWKRKRKII